MARLALAAAVMLLLLAPTTLGQTVLSVDGVSVFEHNGSPLSPTCPYPTGPVTGIFPFPFPSPCPTPAPFAPVAPYIGGVTTDRIKDTTWVTDGLVFGEYSGLSPALPPPVPVNTFPLPPGLIIPGPVTGIAWDAGLGALWITDGFAVAAITPPPAGACVPPAVAFPPFPAPAPAPITGLAWDPSTGTLWSSDLGGTVANFFPGGLIGAGGIFPVVPFPCGQLAPLSGIAYDTTTPGVGSPVPALYASDNLTMSYFNPGGFPAVVPTFYTPVACYPQPVPPTAGLDFTLHPNVFGTGTDPAGLSPPLMTWSGQTCTPSGPLSIGITGADITPGTSAALFVDFGFLCPSLTGLGGNSIYVAPTLIFGPFPLAGGSLLLPFTLPAGLPIGGAVYAQWIVIKGSGGFQASDAIGMTFGLP